MQLLINLTNTNFLPTHFELLRAFLINETSFNRLCDQVGMNPCRSIFNAQFVTFILHILYSNTGPTQQPLIDFLIKVIYLVFLTKTKILGIQFTCVYFECFTRFIVE